jgi:hypothetical protein
MATPGEEWPTEPNPHQPASQWGVEAQRRAKILVSDISEIKLVVEQLRERQALAAAASERNGWKIDQLETQVSGKDGIKDQLKEIKSGIQDFRLVRHLVFAAVGLILLGFAAMWSLERIPH